MAITQNDVAERLGLSQRAVAFALSDSPRAQKQVSAETRKRILAVAKELGYRPHRYAQVMRTGKSNVIGMVRSRSQIQSLEDRARFSALAIRRLGYQDLSYDIGWQSDEMGTACNALIDARVEGVLLTGPDSQFMQAHISRLQAEGIAVASFMNRAFAGVPRVLADNRQGMADLTRHLLAQGYRRLTMIAPDAARSDDPSRGDSVSERIAGFQQAAAASGAQAEIVYQPAGGDRDDPYEAGFQAVRRLLAGPRRPEALVCVNDCYAVGACKACADRNVRVPDEIAITGFDNTTVGRYTPAALTTVEQPIEAMADRAVSLLVEMIRGSVIPANQARVKLPCRLVIRQSCGTPPSAPCPHDKENR